MLCHRRHSYTMQALVNRGQPANEVWYWAAEQVTLYSNTGVVRHTFSDGLGKIRFGSALTYMPQTLRKTAITDVSMPSGVTAINSYAFEGCSSLALAELPAGLTAVYSNAFLNCSSLALTELPAGLTAIGGGAFRGCSSLVLTELPTGLTAVANQVFWGCSGVVFNEFPATVATIGDYAMRYCTGIISLTFLGTPTDISATAFNGCGNLASIRAPWAEGAVAGAPWGATNATITYNYTPQ